MALGNVFLDKELAQAGPTPTQGARRLIQSANQILNANQQFLDTVRKIVARHTVPTLTVELGADETAALQSLYTSIKDLVEAQAPSIEVPNIQ